MEVSADTSKQETGNRTAPGLLSRFRRLPRRRRMVLLVAGVAVISVVTWVWRYFAVRESTDNAQIDGYIVPISARVGGTVQQIHFKENQHVEAGAVLVELDPTDYEVTLHSSEADLAEAKAALEAARIGVPITATTTSSQLSSAQANVERAKAGATAAGKQVDAARARLSSAQAGWRHADANSTLAVRDLERMKQLIAKDEISQQQYDASVAAMEAARAAADAAQAMVEAAQQELHVAESQQTQAETILLQAEADLRSAETAPQRVRVTEAQVALAEARVRQEEASLEQARLRLQYTTIKAPMNGFVSKRNVEIGQTVQAGQPMVALVPVEDIWVTANFKETQLKNMRPGQQATFSVDAYDRTFRGYVESISPATGEKFSLLPPENATGNFVKVVQRVPVRIAIEKGQDAEQLLRPGMSVEPTVIAR